MNRIEDPITEKLRKEPGTATYTFYRIFIGDRAGIAETDAKELVQSIKSFGGSVGIKNFSEVYLHDNESMASLYSTFQIHHTQDAVIVKVASLFAFAASHKLCLANQTFVPK